MYHYIQHCMKAMPRLRKIPIMTSANHERFGAYKIEDGKHTIIFGETKRIQVNINLKKLLEMH